MGQITIECTKDASITSGDTDYTINGDYLYIGRDGSYFRTLLYYTLSALAGKVITAATLRMYEIAGFANTLNFFAHCVSENWSESTVTWDNQPDYTETATASL